MEELIASIEGEIKNKEQKEALAERIAQKVQNGQVIGAGSGSTSWLAVKAIAKRVKEEGMHIQMLPTSYEIDMLCRSLELPVTSLLSATPDWGFDGADEVDAKKRLLKGRGGAMLKEKMNMVNAPITYILVDESKLVERLGTHFAVPVECERIAAVYVKKELEALGATKVSFRKAMAKDGPVITENHNVILDATFTEIPDTLEKEIKSITGVIESGLFIGYPVEIIH